MSAAALVAEVRRLFAGEPVFVAGSLVAAEAYGMASNGNDVDVFCPTSHVLVAEIQRLIDRGFILDERFKRVWYRWLRYGFNKWHTNSLKISGPTGPVNLDSVDWFDADFGAPGHTPQEFIAPTVLGGVELNLVYKLVDGHPATSLAQVLESFDFGLLGMGYEMETDTFRDLRSYLFPDLVQVGSLAYGQPLPMMPSKRANWRGGFISQYNGLREAGRYAKYHRYGYDMELVKDDLVTGYREAFEYLANHFDSDKQLLGQIYWTIAEHIEVDNIADLELASKQIDYNDSLDVIMAALE